MGINHTSSTSSVFSWDCQNTLNTKDIRTVFLYVMVSYLMLKNTLILHMVRFFFLYGSMLMYISCPEVSRYVQDVYNVPKI